MSEQARPGALVGTASRHLAGADGPGVSGGVERLDDARGPVAGRLGDAPATDVLDDGTWVDVDDLIDPCPEAGAPPGPPPAEDSVPDPWDEEWSAWMDTRPPVWAWDLPSLAPSEVPDLVDGVDLDRLDDATLVEVVAAWERVVSWASAKAALAAGALAERESMNPAWPPVAGRVSRPCVAADELAMRLVCSRRAAQRLVADGVAYRRHLAWTGDALHHGHLSPAQARVIVDALADQPMDVALAVQDVVLDDAPRLTPTRLARRVTQEVLRADPAGAAARKEAARTKRRVDRPRPLPDGMAGIWAVLDATDAVRIDNGIDALARAARHAGDPRTLDQLRADVLVDLTLGRICPPPTDGAAGPAGDGAVAPTDDGRDGESTTGSSRSSDSTTNHTHTSDDTTNHTHTNDRHTRDGVGAAVEPSSAADGLVRRAHAPTATHATTTTGATIHAADARTGPAQSTPPSTSGRTTAVSLTGALAAATGRTGTASGADGPQVVNLTGLPQRAVIHVTVPLSTLLGASDEPGHLDGYGPVHADTARALALGGTWQRLVTDPLSGAVLDVGRTRYRPPAALADHVRHRDGTCVAPHCSTPAHACDLDHTEPYEAGGPTADHNLNPACRRDHHLKTHAGYRLTQDAPGCFTWRTPTGHAYTTRPGTGEAAAHHPPSAPWADDPPPF